MQMIGTSKSLRSEMKALIQSAYTSKAEAHEKIMSVVTLAVEGTTAHQVRGDGGKEGGREGGEKKEEGEGGGGMEGKGEGGFQDSERWKPGRKGGGWKERGGMGRRGGGGGYFCDYIFCRMT
jgi:hypothetical protein